VAAAVAARAKARDDQRRRKAAVEARRQEKADKAAEALEKLGFFERLAAKVAADNAARKEKDDAEVCGWFGWLVFYNPVTSCTSGCILVMCCAHGVHLILTGLLQFFVVCQRADSLMLCLKSSKHDFSTLICPPPLFFPFALFSSRAAYDGAPKVLAVKAARKELVAVRDAHAANLKSLEAAHRAKQQEVRTRAHQKQIKKSHKKYSSVAELSSIALGIHAISIRT